MRVGVSTAVASVTLLSALAAAAPATARTDAAAAAAASCPRGSVAARIAGKRTCLRAGQPCKRKLDAQYHRTRFHCHSGRLIRVTVGEARWIARTGAWARGYRSDVTDSLAFVPDWLAQRDPDSLAQLSEFANVLRGCSSQLASFGRPTRRLRPASTLFATGCARFTEAADAYAQLALQPDPDLPARAKTAADAGVAALGSALRVLARLPR